MDAKKHFWVDYLACLIFGAVIVPLWFFYRNYQAFSVVSVFFVIAVFSGVHIGLFCGLSLFLKRTTILYLYYFYSCFWFGRYFGREFCLPLLPVLHPYRYLLGGVFFVVAPVVLLIFCRKWKSDFRVIRLMSVFVYLLFVLTLFGIFKNVFFYRCGSEAVVVDGKTKGNCPNVYHILLDAHPNQECIEWFGGDLRSFYTALEQLGFVTYPESRSVFPCTSCSVSAMFNMDAKVYSNTAGAVLYEFLREKFKHVKLYLQERFLLDLYPSVFAEAVLERPAIGSFEFFCSLLDLTCVGHVSRSFFLRLLASCFRARVHLVLDKMERAKERFGSSGNFFYCHVLAPHAPFIHSEEVPYYFAGISYGIGGSQDYTDPWFHPIICKNVCAVDAFVLPVIRRILSQYDSESVKPIIVVHSDHGIGSASQWRKEGVIYGNLFAIYMPDEWKKDAEDLKFINLYRFIFNHLFGTNYQYLPDVRKNVDGSIFKEKTLSPSEQ